MTAPSLPADRREAILSRLVEVARNVAGVASASRNEVNVPEKEMPAIVVYDADEAAEEVTNDPRRPQLGGASSILVGMAPEAYILVSEDAEKVGSLLNLFRARLIRAVLLDERLKELAGSNGRVQYNGCLTGLSRGRAMEGTMGLGFGFTYPLDPTKLPTT